MRVRRLEEQRGDDPAAQARGRRPTGLCTAPRGETAAPHRHHLCRLHPVVLPPLRPMELAGRDGFCLLNHESSRFFAKGVDAPKGHAARPALSLSPSAERWPILRPGAAAASHKDADAASARSAPTPVGGCAGEPQVAQEIDDRARRTTSTSPSGWSHTARRAARNWLRQVRSVVWKVLVPRAASLLTSSLPCVVRNSPRRSPWKLLRQRHRQVPRLRRSCGAIALARHTLQRKTRFPAMVGGDGKTLCSPLGRRGDPAPTAHAPDRPSTRPSMAARRGLPGRKSRCRIVHHGTGCGRRAARMLFTKQRAAKR